MLRVVNQHLSATVEARFADPVFYQPELAISFARAALTHFAEFDVRSSNLWSRPGDHVLDFEMGVSLFNGLGQVRLSSERLLVSARNARTRQEGEVIVRCVAQAMRCIPDLTFRTASLQAQSHARAPSSSEAEHFLAPSCPSTPGVVEEGVLVVVKEPTWDVGIRLSAERSLAYPSSLFITWMTDPVSRLDAAILQEFANRFDAAAQRIGIQLEFE